MTRTRRLSIEIEQRKLTVTLTPTGSADLHQHGSGDPSLCPTCGKPWTTVSVTGNEAPDSVAAIDHPLRRLLVAGYRDLIPTTKST